MHVFVTGSTGYIGLCITSRLAADGCAVTAMQRPGSLRAWPGAAGGEPALVPMSDAAPSGGNPGSVHRITVDIFDVPAMAEAMRGCDAAVHLVGIIRECPRRGVTMERLHVDATRAVLAAAQSAGVRRIVYVSALGARPDARTRYHQSKWAAEACVRSSGLAWTILRPSVVVGRGGDGPNFVRQLAHLIRSAPVVPVIGNGAYPLQPVHIETLADAVLRALERPRYTALDLGGPEVVTYLQLLERIARALGRSLRTVHIPAWLMQRIVPLLEHLPGFPVTSDQLTMLLEGNACPPGHCEATYDALDLQPRPITEQDLLESL
ncbi:MAG: NAD(P)H-binding protein [Alicyclobacillus sp.]|nr:NAD(P)H-binding protein [Alicyclobacillus sp.]